MKEVLIVCDGSSLKTQGNDQRKAAAVAALVYKGKLKAVGEYLGNATNQQAEVVAACIGLEALKEVCSVVIVSDSEYVVRTMKGEFKRKANHEYWARLDQAAAPHRILWTWTRGHAGHDLQERCDKAARQIARSGWVDADELSRVFSHEG